MTIKSLVITTRESLLALAQTKSIQAALESKYPDLNVSLLGVTTTGDKRLDVTLDKIGGKGLFVKELEEALLAGRADIAVHSMKDVPMELPPGLVIPVIGKREDPRDAFVCNKADSFQQLPPGARVGTSSLRRKNQLCALRPDLQYEDLRGNIHTRLRKLDEGQYDAIILAAAGLNRMGFQSRIRHFFSPEESLPAAGQGALSIECRADDKATLALIAALHDPQTADCVLAERALCRRLQGGCMIPIGAFAELEDEYLFLRGLVANREGTRIIRAEARAQRSEADALGIQVAESLLANGAQEILQDFYDRS